MDPPTGDTDRSEQQRGINALGGPSRGKRASRPCDACRKRKSRCFTKLEGSVCTICELRETACTYLGRPGQRGPPAAAAKSASPRDSLVSVTAANRGIAAEVEVGTAPTSVPDNNVYLSPAGASGGLLSTRTGFAESQSTADRPGAQANLSTVRLDNSLGSEPHRFAELYGLTSDMEPILMRHRPYSAVDDEYRLETHSIRRVQNTDNGMAYPVVFHIVSDTKSAGYSASSSDLDAIEAIVHPYGPRLLRLYWLLVQTSYPIVYRKGFMEEVSKSHRNTDVALRGAIYLKALEWWSYDSDLSLRQFPDAPKLRKLTYEAIQMSFHKPRLSSIAAMLVYLHCNPNLEGNPEEPLTADHTFARGLTSQTLAISEAIGLHLDCSDWSIPRWEKALRKRLSWALYMQDKWTALAYGRPSHITDQNWDVKPLDESDFDDCKMLSEELGQPPEAETPPTSAHAEFMFMVDLSKILSSALTAFFTVRSSQEQDTSKLLAVAQPLLQQLSTWREALLLALPLASSRPRTLSSVGYLYLCYYGVAINIHRRLVRSTALAPLCSDPEVLFTIRQQASQTASEATTCVSSLRLDQLQSFWYFASPYIFGLVGSFHTLLLATSVSAAERDYWRETLTSFLWSLRLMSKASAPMRYAVNRLEGGVLRGMEHALAVDVDPQLRTATVEAADLEQLLQQLQSEQFAYSEFSEYGLQAFDWLNGVQI